MPLDCEIKVTYTYKAPPQNHHNHLVNCTIALVFKVLIDRKREICEDFLSLTNVACLLGEINDVPSAILES